MKILRRVIGRLSREWKGVERRMEEKPRKKLYELYEKFCAYTMIERDVFVRNLVLVERVRNVPGAVVECGVWKGGMSAAMAELLGAGRNYYLLDSFEGLPQAQVIDGPRALNWQKDTASPFFFDNAAADQKYSEEAMALTGVRSYRILKGWFEKTVPGLRVPEGIAVLRLDGDWYESTMTCLKHLYPQLNPGALLIVDDYYAFEGCARALHDFLSEGRLGRRIRQFEDDVCYLMHEDHHKL